MLNIARGANHLKIQDAQLSQRDRATR